LDDFEEAPDVVRSGLYTHVCRVGYYDGDTTPVGAMIANYDFGPNAPDIKLLQNVATVGAMAQAPFIAAAGPQFFGDQDFSKLPQIKNLKALFEGPKYIKWQSFRESEVSRYVGLTMPRFLLRLPYKAFNYEENVLGSHEYLWGNTAYAFATRLTDSFAKYRWCPNIIGPQGGGAVEDLPLHQMDGGKIPTEVLISDRREYDLSEEGFIVLTMFKNSDNAAFFSANSVQKPKFFGISREGKESETSYKLGTQLPYLFIITRLAHYIKVVQREQIRSWTGGADLESRLNEWISQYVSDCGNRRLLRLARITVEEVEGDPYQVHIKVRPHFKYMGADFTLSLVYQLDMY
jgi:type VI secretion system protein ImpC